MNSSPTVRTGLAYEQMALEFLQGEGLVLESRNFRCRFGEIDLVMREDDTTVFVEVRYRRSAQHGGALASIGAGKARRIARTAQYYQKARGMNFESSIRFDVVALDGPQPSLRWLKAAFEF